MFVAIAARHDGYRSARTRSERIDAAQRTDAAIRQLPVVVREARRVADFNARQKSVSGRVVSVFTGFVPAAYYAPPAASQERLAFRTSPAGDLVVKAGVAVRQAVVVGPDGKDTPLEVRLQ